MCFTPGVELLLKMNTDVNISTSREQLLHAAGLKGSAECTSLLIKAGADLTTKDSEGAAPLHAASFGNNSVWLDLLIQTALNIQLEIAKLFIKYGANVFQKMIKIKCLLIYFLKNEGDLFDLSVQSAAQPVLLKDLCHRTICATLGQSRLKYLVILTFLQVFGCI
ncbi:hypothetical protein CEXT_590551 [Caerostris extrusa]|uniref:Uncharacterized protein n=1 Tax=Caerostris extrusa TaxID=172846 RepID=A0AAV4X1D5_CAEEX|nr:hypothetical protein CEXT_590551 [Caerostris extrusa]